MASLEPFATWPEGTSLRVGESKVGLPPGLVIPLHEIGGPHEAASLGFVRVGGVEPVVPNPRIWLLLGDSTQLSVFCGTRDDPTERALLECSFKEPQPEWLRLVAGAKCATLWASAASDPRAFLDGDTTSPTYVTIGGLIAAITSAGVSLYSGAEDG